DGENLTRQELGRQIPVEGHQVDVDGVEHQLDAQQHPDGVAPGQGPPQAQGEQYRRQEEEVIQGNHWSAPSRRARMMAPIMATRSTMDANSKGTKYRVNSSRPMAAAVLSTAGAVGTRAVMPPKDRMIKTAMARDTTKGVQPSRGDRAIRAHRPTGPRAATDSSTSLSFPSSSLMESMTAKTKTVRTAPTYTRIWAMARNSAFRRS